MNHLDQLSGPLAIMPGYITSMVPRMESYIRGEADDLVARYDEAEKKRRVNQDGLQSLSTGTEFVQINGNTAIMHIPGVITKRFGFMTWWYGGSAADEIAFCARVLAQSDLIDNVVINMDSPGGSVSGVALAADAIRNLRKEKNVITVANDMMASAGYWIGSAADQVLVNPSSVVGSIGVFAQIVNYSRLLEELKIDIEIIRAGEFKATPNAFEPLTDTGRSIVQRGVNHHYDLFIEAISLNRNISMNNAKEKANGLVHEGSASIQAGLADGEGTLNETVEALEDANPRKSVFSFVSSMLPSSKKAEPKATTEQPAAEEATEEETAPVEDERLAAMEAQLQALAAQNQRLASLVENQSTALEQAGLAALRDENARFVDHLKQETKVRAASAGGYLATLNLLAGLPEDQQTIAFGDTKTTVFAFLRQELNAALPLVSLEEHAPSEGKDAAAMGASKGIDKAEVPDVKNRAKAWADAEEKRTGIRPPDHKAVAAVVNQN